MRVGLKLTVVILCLLVAVLSVEGWLRLQHEREVFEKDVQHEQQLLGRALRPSIELAWRTEGWTSAQSILARAQKGEAEVRVQLVALSEGARGAAPSIVLPPRAQTLGSEVTTLIEREPAPGVVYTYVPVLGPAGEGTAIELTESLAQTERRLSHSARRVWWTALVMILGGGLLAISLGERIVGQPVRSLAAQAARIAQGDLTPPSPTHRKDEIGQLEGAIGAMVVGLAEARAHVAEETEARLLAQRRLRRGERLAAVGTLAAGVAHELGTPLQIVSGRARMITQAEGASEAVSRNATLIREQVQRMERIVRQLLNLAHPTRVVREPLRMERVVRECVELLGPLAAQRHVELQLRVDAPGEVAGDDDLLSQVITNLVQNAVQAVAEGGHVRVELTEHQEVPLSSMAPPSEKLVRAPSYVCVSVCDDGPGIDPQIRERLFDPFFTTKDVGNGTGLGLSVAHGIVRDHEGWMEVQSEPGDGATFRVWLPTAPPPTESA